MYNSFAIKLFYMLISCFFISNGNTAYTKTLSYNSWLYQFRPETKVSFDNAKAFCAGLGGNLITPKTDEELEFLKNEMKVIDTEIEFNLNPFKNGYWLGLKVDLTGKKPVWKWLDGTNLAGNDKNKNWIKGQPDSPEIEKCATMIYTLNTDLEMFKELDFFGKWNDENCKKNYSFICKYKETAVTVETTTLINPSDNCYKNTSNLITAISVLTVSAILLTFVYFGRN